ncbi:eukaryotic translation initiation factor 4E-1B isoform X1 [Sinocyclocheilus rhinocerous]|uniref:Eukaryotic translation initiation factor 4E-1B n=2 Tax=Sinocyclocheilus rhinocerous TaxID=307959 RepID=A0A673GEH3_9TELE|nr:PREDICTED: eukaryotic translation initiation factor 4E-1B isoform X1 [Sinocyclocheilus rhinocerous]
MMASCAVQLIEKVTRKKAEKLKFETNILKGPCMKHPLQNRWGLWFYKNDKSKMWQDNLRLITKFDTVEDFWALNNNIQPPSKLSSGCDYSMFKDGIEPMWEDRSNKCGGRWLITLAKQHRHTELDHFWLETLLCLIGEGFGSFSRDVCGSVINIRAKGDKIAIWTSNAENCETVTHIGKKYKESLGLPQKLVIGYQAHADTATKSNSITKNKFVV